MNEAAILRRVRVRESVQSILDDVDLVSWKLQPEDIHYLLRVLFDFAYERLDEKPIHMKLDQVPMTELESNEFEHEIVGRRQVAGIPIISLEKLADKPDEFKSNLRRYLAGTKARARYKRESK